MKIIIAVVVYDRFDNIEEWIRCYKMSIKDNSELIIIHNIKNEADMVTCRNICLRENIKYVCRGNIGYDIGALQDVFNERLIGFPNNWDYLLWATDDYMPMKKTFITDFLDKLQDSDIGIVCTELAKEVKLHIRTSGFIISKDISRKIKFPAEQITTKAHCYEFEHRNSNSFLEQINEIGKNTIQVYPEIKDSCLWDINHRQKLNRWEEHYSEFPKKTVLFIATIYNSYPQIISSLICQTMSNWELLLIHDGKNDTNIKQIVQNFNDERITYIEYPERINDYGHTLRKWALNEIKNKKIDTKSDYIVITNADNYYVPTFIEKMVTQFDYSDIIVTYCSGMLHSYKSPQPEGDHEYGTIKTKLELGHIDCGGIMVKKDEACEIGWNNLDIYSDWTYIEDIIKKYGKDKFSKILGTLFIHN